MSKIETRICEDCGEQVITSIDKTGMLIRYEKMCPCLKEIMELRGKRASEFKKRKSTAQDNLRGKLFHKGV